MAKKNLDTHNRWRNITVSFRVSPQESRKINYAANLYGMTKQDYIITCLTQHKVIVQGNSRIYKSLRDRMQEIHSELRRIEAGATVDEELLTAIHMISEVMDGLKEEVTDGR